MSSIRFENLVILSVLLLIPLVAILPSLLVSEQPIHTGIIAGTKNVSSEEFNVPINDVFKCSPIKPEYLSVSEVNKYINSTRGNAYIVITKYHNGTCYLGIMFAPCMVVKYYFVYTDYTDKRVMIVPLNITSTMHYEGFKVVNGELVINVKEYYPFNQFNDRK